MNKRFTLRITPKMLEQIDAHRKRSLTLQSRNDTVLDAIRWDLDKSAEQAVQHIANQIPETDVDAQFQDDTSVFKVMMLFYLMSEGFENYPRQFSNFLKIHDQLTNSIYDDITSNFDA